MIVKPYNQSTTRQDRRQRAGADAESQMAHYLHRGFKDDPDVYVLHGLRIEDPASRSRMVQPVCARSIT